MDFQDFWAAYPVKRGRLDALKAWTKLNPPPLVIPQMLEAIEQQKRCKQWRDGFIPWPATWLRRGCWLDELNRNDFYQAKL